MKETIDLVQERSKENVGKDWCIKT
jgi:hypothetical protein